MQTIYLDPTNTQTGQNGTIENPYSSFNQFTLGYSTGLVLPGDSEILIKRGTVLDEFPNRYGLNFRRNNIRLSSYGEGPRPIIKHSTTNTRAHTCVIGQSENIYVHGIAFYGGKEGDHYRGGAFVMAAEPVGTRTWNIHIYDCEIAYYDMAIYMDQYPTDAGVVLGNIFIGDPDLKLGNEIHHTWTDGCFFSQASVGANTGQFYFGYNHVYLTSQGYNYGEICSSGAEGDQLQVIYFNDGIIEHNLFDKRGVSGKMVVLWSLDPASRDGHPNDTTRNLVFRYNTILPGFRFKEGYYCPDGYNIGNHNAIQIYACDKIWFHGNKIDTTQWDYKVNERYGKTEQPVAAISRMDGRKVYCYDNEFIGILPGNLLQSGAMTGEIQIDFVNNTVVPYYYLTEPGINFIFTANGQKINMQNNIMIGSNDIVNWIVGKGAGSTDISNVVEKHGSGEGMGDLEYFGNKYGFVDAVNKDFKLTSNSILKNSGVPFTFNMAGWAGYETSVRFDPAGVARPVGTWDIGGYEFIEPVNPVPSPITNVWISDITNNKSKCNWEKVLNATGYKITLIKGGVPVEPYQNYDVGDVSEFNFNGLISNSEYSFFVKGYNAYGEGYGMSKDFTTLCNAPIINNFVASKTNPIVGENVNFSADIVSEGQTTYSWFFENGIPSESDLQNPSVKWNNLGLYYVSLKVSNNGGSATMIKDDYIRVVEVIVPPNPSFSINVTPGTPVSFTDFSTGNPKKWEWTFKGAVPGTSNLKNPTGIVWKTPGRYDVALSVTNESGTTTKILSGLIFVGKFPSGTSNTR